MRPPIQFIFFLLLAIAFTEANAQDSVRTPLKKAGLATDSIQDKIKQKTDTINGLTSSANNALRYSNEPLNKLQSKFHHQTDSLQKSYAAPVKGLDARIKKLNHKKDSLNKLHVPTTSLTHEIDSLQREKSILVNELNARISKTKKETLDKVNALHLPPEAQKEIDAFSKNIRGFSVPSNFFLPKAFGMSGMSVPGLSSLPSVNAPTINIPSVDLSKLSIPSANIPSLQKVNINSMKLPSLSQMEGSLGNEINKAKQLGKSLNEKSIEKEALNAASQNKEVKSLLKEQKELEAMKKQASQLNNPKKADSLAMQQLKPAVNHFAGKEQELKAAMDKVSKLKQKYSSVKSLAELPKRAPNPLRDKPWIERIIPGVNYFVQNKHYALVDLNPYLGWRFTPKLSATVGWNQRIGIVDHTLHTNRYDRVYGVRATASYLWTHGINFKIAPEVMNAYVPTNGTPDTKHQATIWGVYAGVRKDFPIYKVVKGYSEVMYNFTQKPFRNVYGDPVSFRFGIELQLKKKVKK